MAGAENALATIFVFGRDSASIAVREQNIATGEKCTRQLVRLLEVCLELKSAQYLDRKSVNDKLEMLFKIGFCGVGAFHAGTEFLNGVQNTRKGVFFIALAADDEIIILCGRITVEGIVTIKRTVQYLGSLSYRVQSRKLIDPGCFGLIRFFGCGRFRSAGKVCSLQKLLQCVLHGEILAAGGGEPGKTGVQLFGIIDLSDDQHDAVAGKRDRFNHQRIILDLETKIGECLLHHFLKQPLRFGTSICQLAKV